MNLLFGLNPKKKGNVKKWRIPLVYHSTVTDFAKFLGWSTSFPLHTAT